MQLMTQSLPEVLNTTIHTLAHGDLLFWEKELDQFAQIERRDEEHPMPSMPAARKRMLVVRSCERH